MEAVWAVEREAETEVNADAYGRQQQRGIEVETKRNGGRNRSENRDGVNQGEN